MLKKLYKSANDSIPQNNELLQKLITISNEKKHKKSFSFLVLSKYALPISAVLLLAVFLPKFETINKMPNSIITQDTASIANEPEKTSENIKNYQCSDLSSSKEASVQQPISEKADTPGNVTEKNEVQPAGGENFKGRSAKSNNDESVMIMSEDFSANDVLSPYDYLKIFGIDLNLITLPEGVVLQTNQVSVKKDNNDNIIWNDVVLTFGSNEKSLTVLVFKNENSQSESVSDNSSVYINLAHFDIIFKADFAGFSTDEIKAFVNSVKENGL